jgi:hypothetical protein
MLWSISTCTNALAITGAAASQPVCIATLTGAFHVAVEIQVVRGSDAN